MRAKTRRDGFVDLNDGEVDDIEGDELEEESFDDELEEEDAEDLFSEFSEDLELSDELEEEYEGVDDFDDGEGLQGGLEAMADAALEDEDSADELVGALASMAAKAAPRVMSKVIPQVLKATRRVLRTGSRAKVRRLPKSIRKTVPWIRKNQRSIKRQPAIVVRVILRNMTGKPMRMRARRVT